MQALVSVLLFRALSAGGWGHPQSQDFAASLGTALVLLFFSFLFLDFRVEGHLFSFGMLPILDAAP